MTSQSDRLELMTDAELEAIVEELAERGDQFDAKTRMLVNDELRRRRLPLVDVPRRRR